MIIMDGIKTQLLNVAENSGRFTPFLYRHLWSRTANSWDNLPQSGSYENLDIGAISMQDHSRILWWWAASRRGPCEYYTSNIHTLVSLVPMSMRGDTVPFF